MGRSKSIVKKQPYIRKEIYSIDEVYNAVKDGLFEEKKTFVDMDGDMIKANSQRYLYAVDQDGEEVMMTKDHIIPVSKGGKNTLENYQTMCRKCNVQKGNKLV